MQSGGQPCEALASASSMIRQMVRMQRPHCALHPRQRYTCAAERGAATLMAWRTSWSLSTLQEQTIIAKIFPRRFLQPQNANFATDFIDRSQNENAL